MPRERAPSPSIEHGVQDNPELSKEELIKESARFLGKEGEQLAEDMAKKGIENLPEKERKPAMKKLKRLVRAGEMVVGAGALGAGILSGKERKKKGGAGKVPKVLYEKLRDFFGDLVGSLGL